MKTTLRKCFIGACIAATMAAASADVITVGVPQSGNSIPLGNAFVGTTPIVRYQQIYGASAFGSIAGPMYINGLNFFATGESAGIAAGNYTIRFGTTTKPVSTSPGSGNTGLSLTNLDSNFDAGTGFTFFTGAIAGGLSFVGDSFLYDRTKGNLVMELLVHSQSPNGVFFDVATAVNDQISRVFSTTGNTAFFEQPRARSVGLVTQFDWSSSLPEQPSTAVPEPGSILLMGLGVMGLIGASRRRKT